VFTANESGLLNLALDPALHHQPLDLPVLLAGRRQRSTGLSRFTVNGDTLDLTSEKVLPRPAGPTRRMLPTTARAWSWTRPAATCGCPPGDNTNPFSSDSYTPIDQQPGREGVSTRSAARATPTACPGKILRIHPQPNGNLHDPGREHVPARHTALTKPEIYQMGERKPVSA